MFVWVSKHHVFQISRKLLKWTLVPTWKSKSTLKSLFDLGPRIITVGGCWRLTRSSYGDTGGWSGCWRSPCKLTMGEGWRGWEGGGQLLVRRMRPVASELWGDDHLRDGSGHWAMSGLRQVRLWRLRTGHSVQIGGHLTGLTEVILSHER